jgi:integrase
MELALYSARHSFASDIRERTGNLRLVMDALGHESVTTTQKYLHPSQKGISEIVNQRNLGRAEEVAAASACHVIFCVTVGGKVDCKLLI